MPSRPRTDVDTTPRLMFSSQQAQVLHAAADARSLEETTS